MKTKLLVPVLTLAAFGSVLTANPTYAMGKGMHHSFVKGGQVKARYETRLEKLVVDKKITDAQKMLIENKLKELISEHKSEKDALKNMTRQERRAHREKELADLLSWAKQNGIDPQYLPGGMWHKATK